MSEILNGLRERLIKEDNEAVLVSSEENQRYVSGFHYSDGYILVSKTTAYLLADFRYIEAARKKARGHEIRGYRARRRYARRDSLSA